MDGLEEILDFGRNLIEFFQGIFTFIANIFRSLILAFSYLIQMIPKIMNVILTLPAWLMSFATITIGVCVAYFIVGRQAGKSD